MIFFSLKKKAPSDDDHILGEIGDVLLAKVKGRESGEDITLFKSLGLAVEDVAAAHHIYQKLSEQGGGQMDRIQCKQNPVKSGVKGFSLR